MIYVHKDGESDPLKPFTNGVINPPPPSDMNDAWYDNDRNLAGNLDDEIEKDYGKGYEIREWVSIVKSMSSHMRTRFSGKMTLMMGIRLEGEAYDKFNFDYLLNMISGEASDDVIPQRNNFRLDSQSRSRMVNSSLSFNTSHN